MSDSVQPHRWQPTRLRLPWDSPGKNTGVGCHILLQCMKVKSEVAQACSTLSNPMDCSLPGSSVHGIFQARVLEWGLQVLAKTILITTLRWLVAYLLLSCHFVVIWPKSHSQKEAQLGIQIHWGYRVHDTMQEYSILPQYSGVLD